MSEYNSPEQNRLYVANHRARRMDRGEREVRTWLDTERLGEVDAFAAMCGVSRSDAIAALVGSGLERAVKPRARKPDAPSSV